MLKAKLKVLNQLGLHARAAAQLVQLAGKFGSRIELIRDKNSRVADGKSILSVLALAATKGTEVEITIEGSDETQALNAIAKLFRNGFGEL